ncbi:hypothetical protein BDD43_5104 [Mucilaginibacter gracilis]|uniref:Tetratricopeptide repeat protein n=1 Tax=Mucilaginibacter gracilis TaxID=423350 RepID=A0A495J7Y0_9SPHI|nr:hypothetical protein [Mucilaginibacter gracilis]RKR84851.1 hypothetical protein BDD43_5104 [Mucilaginibacter gracilis]
MLKKVSVLFLLVCFLLGADAVRASIQSDLPLICKIKDQNQRERKLVSFVKSVFEYRPADSLVIFKGQVNLIFDQYNIDKVALNYFIDCITQQRLQHLDKADNFIGKAIEVAAKNSDHYLLYSFFTHMAFMHTYKGNTIEAVTSFRLAKKEATILNDDYLQVLIAINISDIYYHNNFYGQSLSYLNLAASILQKQHINEQRLINLVNYNKAENFFRMRELDSLTRYADILNHTLTGTYKLYIFKNRINYCLTFLQRNYSTAIKQIIALKTDKLYKFDLTDQQNLADAYFNANLPDSAKHTIDNLLALPELYNHPEVKFHLYEVLGAIAQNEHNGNLAATNYKEALLQVEDQVNRLTQVGNIQSQMKIDEVQGAYIQKEEAYKHQRMWLIFIIIAAVLSIGIVAVFYRQKRYYEKLLFTTKKEELAFINSHEVRRHLSNIIGIITVIKHSDDKFKDYQQAEEHLFTSTQGLDDSIKNISDKLDN